MGTPTLWQTNFRIRNDDGSESAATWRQNQNVSDTVERDINFRVRFLIDEQNSAAWTSKTFNLYYSKNSAAYAAVTDSTPVFFSASANFTDGADCTSQLTGGSGTFVTDNNGMKETTGGATNSGSKNYYFEIEFCLQLDEAALVNGDTIDLRIYDGSSALASYTNTPRITYSSAVTRNITSAPAGTSSATTAAKVNINMTSTHSGTSSLTVNGKTLGVIFSDGFNDGTTNAWTGVNNSPTVSAGSAAAGTAYGIEVNASSEYAYKNITIDTNTIRYRWYLNKNSYAIGTATEYQNVGAQVILDGSYSGYTTFSYMRIANNSGTLQIRPTFNDDTNTANNGSYVNLASGDLCIEVQVTRESSDGAADGAAEWWIDEVSQGTVTGIDNYNIFPTISSVRLGEIGTRAASGSGTSYWDELVVRNDNTEIGKLSTTINITSAPAGTSSVVTAAKVYINTTSAPSGTSSLTAVGKDIVNATASASGTSSLTASGTRAGNLSTTAAGTSSITAVGVVILNFTASTPGTSSVVSAAVVNVNTSSAPSGTSALTVNGETSTGTTYNITSSPAGTSAITVNGARAVNCTASSSGTSSLTADGKRAVECTSSVLGTSVLTVDGKRAVECTSSISGTSSVVTAGLAVINASASASGTSQIVVNGEATGGASTYNVTASASGLSALTVNAACNINATSSTNATSALTASGTRAVPISVTVSGMSSLIAACVVAINTASAPVGTSSVIVNGSAYVPHNLSASLWGTSVLVVSGAVYNPGTVSMADRLINNVVVRDQLVGNVVVVDEEL